MHNTHDIPRPQRVPGGLDGATGSDAVVLLPAADDVWGGADVDGLALDGGAQQVAAVEGRNGGFHGGIVEDVSISS